MHKQDHPIYQETIWPTYFRIPLQYHFIPMTKFNLESTQARCSSLTGSRDGGTNNILNRGGTLLRSMNILINANT